MFNQFVLYHGVGKPPPLARNLRVGPIQVIYSCGEIRDIWYGDQLVLKGIYVSVRDKDWRTVPTEIISEKIENDGESFVIKIEAVNQAANVDFTWSGEIAGQHDGRITFKLEGKARKTFTRARTGLCVLHPIDGCSGHPYKLIKSDGSMEEGFFPSEITADRFLTDIRGLTYEVDKGMFAEVTFKGDVFEIEDQRNWTDASYKIYCPPLTPPYVDEIKAGTMVCQSVLLRLIGNKPRPDRRVKADRASISLGATNVGKLPRIGLGVATHGDPLTLREIERLEVLNLTHLRVGLRPKGARYLSKLERACKEANVLGIPLEVALFLSDNAELELDLLREAFSAYKPSICSWLVFHERERTTSQKWIDLARNVLGEFDETVPIGSGTNYDFFQINKIHPPVSRSNLICYPITPQRHAFDCASIMETLPIQGTTVRQAEGISAGLPIAVTPITLKPVFATEVPNTEADPRPGNLPLNVDPRQMSLFGAVWTLGSIKYLAETGASSLTYFQTTGWKGVMETESGSPLPDVFFSKPGMVFPMYHIFADAGEYREAEVIATVSSDPSTLIGLTLRKGKRLRLLLGNLTMQTASVLIKNLSPNVQLRILDEENAVTAMCYPEKYREQQIEEIQTIDGRLGMRLRPYAIARIDCQSDDLLWNEHISVKPESKL